MSKDSSAVHLSMPEKWEQSLISQDLPICDAIQVLDKVALQICVIVDSNRTILGTITDGDIRRGILNSIPLDGPVSTIMRKKAITGKLGQSKQIYRNIMESNRIRQLPILDDEGAVLGLVLLDSLLVLENSRDNWVVLLAGGLGTRLRPLTEETPKPMVDVGGKPILQTILEAFIERKFRKFYISVNYLAEQVEDYFGDGSRWNVEIRYLHETKRLGTAGSLSLIDEEPSAPLVVANGDLLTKVNFEHFLNYHHEHPSIATIGVREYDFQVPFGVVTLDNQIMASIDEKPIQKFLVNAGIYVIEPEVLNFIPKDEALDMPDLLHGLKGEGHDISVFPIREYWLDIGRLEDFKQATSEFSENFE
jgi:dTDP-glucose pyrophosphorylase